MLISLQLLTLLTQIHKKLSKILNKYQLNKSNYQKDMRVMKNKSSTNPLNGIIIKEPVKLAK